MVPIPRKCESLVATATKQTSERYCVKCLRGTIGPAGTALEIRPGKQICSLSHSLMKPCDHQVRKARSHARPLERLACVCLDVESMRRPWENDYAVISISSLLQCAVDIRNALRYGRVQILLSVHH